MSTHIVYGCQCLNIKIHLDSKYKVNQDKSDTTFVSEPFPGWQLDLGMGGIIIEYSALIKTTRNKTYSTVSCLNCAMSPIYSIKEQDSPDNRNTASRVIVHEKAVCGQAVEDIKETEEYSNTFNIKVAPTATTDIPQEIPEELLSTQQQLQAVLNQSIEKLSLESKVRIEKYKKEEERKLQDFISQAKLENNYLLAKLINLHDEDKEKKQQDEEEIVDHRHHVRFNDHIIQQDKKKKKSTGFVLDESQIRGLENKIITEPTFSDREELDDEQEEDMFNLDEEFSEDDNNNNEEEEENKSEAAEPSQDVLGTSWMRKKRNTSKYLIEDFDISRFKNTTSRRDDTEEDDTLISKYATSVPISIHYPQFDDDDDDDDEGEGEAKEQDDNKRKHKKDLLTSSFANYDFSYPDRMLSEQFPQKHRKSITSNSLIRPQLDTLVGKSLDTRDIMQKKQNIREQDEENFGPMLPPHVWTAMAAKDEEDGGGV